MPGHLTRAIRQPTTATELRTWTTDLVHEPVYNTVYPNLHLLHPELTLSMSYINKNEWSVRTRARPECILDQDAMESAREAAPTEDNVSPTRNSSSNASIPHENVASLEYLNMIQQSYESQFTFKAKRTAVILKNGNPRRILRKKRAVENMSAAEIDTDMATMEGDVASTPRSASTSTGLFGSDRGSARTVRTPEDSISRRRRKAIELPRLNLPWRRRTGRRREDVEVGGMEDADEYDLRQLEASFPTVSRRADGTLDAVSISQPASQPSTQEPEGLTYTPTRSPLPDWPLPAQPLPCHGTTGKQKVSWLPSFLRRTDSRSERSHVRMSLDSAININTSRRSWSSSLREVFSTEHLQKAI